MPFVTPLAVADPQVHALIQQETERQEYGLELIASENFVSEAVLEATGSTLTNKYAEGLPGKRYYGGCEVVDLVENLAIERARQLFGAEHANVQPHAGSQANMAAYFALLKPGDTILSLSLAQGGHLTHGSPVNFSGRLFQVHHYGLDPKTETIDYDAAAKLAREVKPKVIVVGASAYPRTLDFARFREIADEVGAVLISRHRPHRGPGRHRAAPQPRALRGRGHHHHAQDAARPALGAHPLQGRARQGHRLQRVPRHAGRPARARDRRQGGRVRRGAAA